MLVLERIGHVAVDDPLRQPLDDRRLADARLADQHRIVLGATRQDLHHPADLLVAADDGVELALARDIGEIAREALQCLVLALRILIGDAMRPAHTLQRGEEVFPRDAIRREQLARGRAFLLREGEQDVFGRNVGVAERLRVLVGAIEHARQLSGKRRLSPARLFGKALDFALGVGLKLRDVESGLLQQRDDDTFILLQQGGKQVRVVDDGVAL
jgi:hypothetical protein